MTLLYVLTHNEYPDYDQSEMVVDGIYSSQEQAEKNVDTRNKFGYMYSLYSMELDAKPIGLTKSAGLFESKTDENMTFMKSFPYETLVSQQSLSKVDIDNKYSNLTESICSYNAISIVNGKGGFLFSN